MDETSTPDLLDVVRQARHEVPDEVAYRPLLAQLHKLEDAARDDRVTPELAEETAETIMQFPGLLRPQTKAVRRPGEAGESVSALRDLENKLISLTTARS